MRPDPTDIIIKKRLRRSRKKTDYGNALAKILRRLSGVIFLFSMTALISLNFEKFVNYIDRPITKIRIKNQWSYVDGEEIKKVVSTKMGTGFFRFDLRGMKHDLESLPWVDEATINRLWPDTVSFNLREQVAIAYWNNEGLLNPKGEIFTPTNLSQVTGIPHLKGPDGSQLEIMEQFEAFNKILKPSGLKLSGIRLSDRGSWNLTVNDSIHITVGRSKLNSRLERFIKLYKTNGFNEDYRNSEIDLRYENGIAAKKLVKEFTELAYR
tara:strand:+ start:19951 stop:20751 length:801 start_codon:yes stop_codon:yes gene_type:complete